MDKATRSFQKAVACFNEAKQFQFVSDKHSNVVEDIVSSLYPCVVCYCFACELYSKALLLLRSNTSQSTHELKVLFDSFDEEDSSFILSIYKEKDPKPLQDLLSEINKGFVHWRYAYEVDDEMKICLSGLAEYCHALRDYVEHLLKTQEVRS